MRYVRNHYHQPRTITVDDLKRKYGHRQESSSLASPSIAPVGRPSCDLTLTQQCALLRLSHQHAHQLAARWLVDNGICPAPSAADFAALASLGLAEKKAHGPLHKITIAGLQIVGGIGAQLIVQHSIHQPWIAGGQWIYTRVNCTCGWSASVRKGDFAQANAMRFFAQHLAGVRASKDVIATLEAGLSRRPAKETA